MTHGCILGRTQASPRRIEPTIGPVPRIITPVGQRSLGVAALRLDLARPVRCSRTVLFPLIENELHS